MIRTGGGTFDPREECAIFITSNTDRQQFGAAVHDHVLVAVNELKSPAQLNHLDVWLGRRVQVFLDSGVFNLTNEHKRKHGCTMDEALALPPDQIDGFAVLWARYLDIIGRYGDASWGYIELDQGGRENKIKTRAKLEALGLRPIPVYHPLNDGWDYFDYLAERYDRICFGNIVQADDVARRRIIATAWERHRKYPHLWIHLLGYTPDEHLHTFPANSADSSTWLSAVRWDGVNERIDNRAFSRLHKNMQYALGSEASSEIGSHKACMLSALAVKIHERNWRAHLRAYATLGADRFPAPLEGEPTA